MVITIENDEIVIRLPLEEPHLSSTEKSFLIGGTGGYLKSHIKHLDRYVSVICNVTIPNPDYKKP